MSDILSFMWNFYLFWMYCLTSEKVSAEEKLTHSSDHINSLVPEGNSNIGYQILHSVRNTSNGSDTSSENNVIQTIGNYSNPVNILSIFSNNSSENSSENYLIRKYNVDQSYKSDSIEDSQFRFIVENSTGNIAWQIYGVNRSFDDALKFPREMAMGTILKLLKEEQLELYAPITFLTNNDLCNKHLRLYRDSLVSNMSSWALKMFDSSSKIQYGLLTGNIFNMGNFDECLSVNVPDAAHAPLRGQHCIVEMSTRSAKRLSIFQYLPEVDRGRDAKSILAVIMEKTNEGFFTAVELNTTSALANYATEPGNKRVCQRSNHCSECSTLNCRIESFKVKLIEEYSAREEKKADSEVALEQIHAVAEEFVTLLSESAISTQMTRSNDVWCVDNGATTHMCHDKSSFLELTRTVNQKRKCSHICVEREETPFGKKCLSTADRHLIPDFIGSLVQHESEALDNVATRLNMIKEKLKNYS
uniref:Nose resistant-to-fluoxetine protein N-terminal domain-containing protein n=1 Tax=Timema shepardi TaxID=629360 RepID=A0A7R9B0H7_TIMSH|nr:unnamed protein product [Timema shepardi]